MCYKYGTMCGIAGCWLKRPVGDGDIAIVARASEALAHRGPDSDGVWVDRGAGVVLAHRRLSIVDLSPTGHQPMVSASGRYCVAYNGEIYDFVERRQELEASGARFRGDSDTEVLLELRAQRGPEFLRDLRGMFALAVWDAEEQRLLLARDRVGKKPLHWCVTPHGLYFASEISALHGMLVSQPGAEPSIDPVALDGYLTYGAVLGERTIWAGVESLLPGTSMTFDGPCQRGASERYWQIDWTRQVDVGFDAAVERTGEILRDATRLRLRADVEVGVLLSGGIDSGLVAALAAETASGPVATFSIGFADAKFDERALARTVAERYGTEHHEILIEDDVEAAVPRILAAYGEPFADDSAIPSWFVAKHARRHRKVVLNGDGGDELFCGYRRHRAARCIEQLRRLLPFLTAPAAMGVARRILPRPRGHRTRYAFLHRVVRALAAKGESRSLVLSSDGFTADERRRLYGDSGVGDIRGTFLPEHLEPLRALDDLERLVALDFEASLPDALLVKMDIATMAHSLEARSPFLDQELVEWAFSLPWSVRLRGRETKPVLRALAARYLPDAVVNAPKRGFEAPLRDWLEGGLAELRDDAILASGGLLAERFDRGYLESLLRGRDKERVEPGRWSRLVWTLLALAVWDRECVRGSTIRTSKIETP